MGMGGGSGRVMPKVMDSVCSFDIVGAPVRLSRGSLQLCHLTASTLSLKIVKQGSQTLGVKTKLKFRD